MQVKRHFLPACALAGEYLSRYACMRSVHRSMQQTSLSGTPCMALYLPAVTYLLDRHPVKGHSESRHVYTSAHHINSELKHARPAPCVRYHSGDFDFEQWLARGTDADLNAGVS